MKTMIRQVKKRHKRYVVVCKHLYNFPFWFNSFNIKCLISCYDDCSSKPFVVGEKLKGTDHIKHGQSFT